MSNDEIRDYLKVIKNLCLEIIARLDNEDKKPLVKDKKQETDES